MNCQLGEERSNITAWSAERSGQLTGSRAIVSLALSPLCHCGAVCSSAQPSSDPRTDKTIYGLKWKYPASPSLSLCSNALPSPCIVNLAPSLSLNNLETTRINHSKEIQYSMRQYKIFAIVNIIFYIYLS